MKKEKYNSMPLEYKEAVERLVNVSVGDVRIKNPNNPVQLMDGKILVFKM